MGLATVCCQPKILSARLTNSMVAKENAKLLRKFGEQRTLVKYSSYNYRSRVYKGTMVYEVPA